MNNGFSETSKHGLQCDEKDCDYVYILNKDESYDQYINASCPKCGANLLTQQDYDTLMEMFKIMNEVDETTIAGAVFPEHIQELIDKLQEPDKQVKLKIEFVDGVPVMSSDDPEVQGFIDAIEQYKTEQIKKFLQED